MEEKMEAKNTKHFWLKEIANHFGMNTDQFAKAVGYSRAALYGAAGGHTKLRKAHIEMACFKLGAISERILRDEILSANERHETRLKLVRGFEKRFVMEE